MDGVTIFDRIAKQMLSIDPFVYYSTNIDDWLNNVLILAGPDN